MLLVFWVIYTSDFWTAFASNIEITVVEPKPAPGADSKAYDTAYRYVVTFYPRWFTYHQSRLPLVNHLMGPRRVGPRFRAVVAVNDDTLYAGTFIDLTEEPVVVTVPATRCVYSVLHLDGYGRVFNGIPPGKPGVYALTGPGWSGVLPAGVFRVSVPYNRSELLFRADKYSLTRQDTQADAKVFRESLRSQTLSRYRSNPDGGSTWVVPGFLYFISYKIWADSLLSEHPLKFLEQLRTAIDAPSANPLSKEEQALATALDTLLDDASKAPQLKLGARAAYADIQSNYLTHKLPGSQWISFNNIGKWDQTPQGYLDRSSITEFIQFGNNIDAALYFHTFNDSQGIPLDGSKATYGLTFTKEQLPEVRRFWSVTVYVPDSIAPSANELNKFNVASYTPGLVSNADGSLTITFSSSLPKGISVFNWVPVPNGVFNVMLRAYGPQGRLLENRYVPPPVVGAMF